MLGLLGTLNLASRSLQTQQAGIAVSGQNLANVNTPGYARQTLVIGPSPDVMTAAGPEGTGADATAIQSLRSSILDQQVATENSVTGSLTAQQQALQTAEADLGASLTASSSASGSTSAQGLSQGLSNLFNAFESLSTNPSDPSQRQSLVSTASSLAAQFNQVAQSLGGLRGSLNQTLQSNVTQANQDLSDIAQLNSQIIQQEQASPGTANELEDSLQQKIGDLSTLVKVDTTTEANGAVNVSIGGTSFVTGMTQNDHLALADAGGGQLLLQAQSSGASITPTGGGIEGIIEARDGGIATLQSQVNSLASNLITQVNATYAVGYGLNGTTGGTFFTGSSAADIAVNSSLAADPTLLQASGTSGASGDNQVALALAQLGSKAQSSLANQTYSESYAGTVAQLGSSISSVNDQLSTQQTVATMLSSQQNSVEGVSINEEMTNLTKYQQAFQASADLVTTINQMLTDVVTMKTV
jgi:flagellar hook-associated protein 1 FlgK